MKKAVITAVALTLVLCLAISGTLAYLVATSGPVTNTFTVGDINIELKEHNLQADGTLGTTEVNSNNTYKVVPGGSQPKDPFVRVEANSEACYVYVCIKNNLKIGDDVVVTYDITSDWQRVANAGDKVLYRYESVVVLSNVDQELSVFENVTYANTILKENIKLLEGKTIVLNAYAHQSANVDQSVADTAATAWFNALQ